MAAKDAKRWRLRGTRRIRSAAFALFAASTLAALSAGPAAAELAVGFSGGLYHLESHIATGKVFNSATRRSNTLLGGPFLSYSSDSGFGACMRLRRGKNGRDSHTIVETTLRRQLSRNLVLTAGLIVESRSLTAVSTRTRERTSGSGESSPVIVEHDDRARVLTLNPSVGVSFFYPIAGNRITPFVSASFFPYGLMKISEKDTVDVSTPHGAILEMRERSRSDWKSSLAGWRVESGVTIDVGRPNGFLVGLSGRYQSQRHPELDAASGTGSLALSYRF